MPDGTDGAAKPLTAAAPPVPARPIQPGDLVKFAGRGWCSALVGGPGRVVGIDGSSAEVEVLTPGECLGNKFRKGERFFFGLRELAHADEPPIDQAALDLEAARAKARDALAANALQAVKSKAIRIEDDAAFPLADGLQLGSVAETGDLRVIVTQADGKQVAVQLHNKWLHGEMGVAAFILANCHPDAKPKK
ncbi:MAG: hypothetical protein LC623_05360 [Halobacteriales archaeon]|nr:hypothetical protein [Halobacteriales archaeon]